MLRRRLGRLLYGAAAFLFLVFSFEMLVFQTPIFPMAFDKAFGGQVRINYTFAWSWWPGTIRVHDFRLTGEDDNVEWQLGIDRVAVSYSMLALFHREFHATRVDGDGLTWALRIKQLLLDVTPETLYGIPSIPGFEAMPLKPYGPPELDTDANYKLWTIHLDRVDAVHVREVWVQKMHFVGDGQITGGFFLKPLRQLKVMAQVEPHPFELLFGDDIVATELRGHLGTTIHPFDIRAHGSIVPTVDVAASLTGQLGNLAFLKRMLPEGTTLSAEPGPLKIDAVIEQGVLKPPSNVELTTPRLHLAKAPFAADGAAAVSLTSKTDANGRGEASAGVELSSFQLAIAGTDSKPAEAKRIRVAAVSDQLDLAKPLAMSGFSADVEQARISDLELLETLIPDGSKLRIEGGSAELHGHVDSTADKSNGGIFFSAHEARVSGADTHLRADVEGELLVHGRNPASGPVDLAGSHLSIDHAQVTGAGGRDWWGKFEFPKASLDTEKKSISLELRAACLDSRPVRALFAVEGVPGFVATIFTMPGLQITGKLHVAPKLLRLTDFDAHGDGASIKANYLSRGEEKKGEALIKLGIATAGLDLDDGKTHVKLIGASSWFDDRTKKADAARASGTVPQR